MINQEEKKWLNVMVWLTAAYLLVSAFINFAPVFLEPNLNPSYIEIPLSIFLQISNLLIILYLFRFVRIIKNQRQISAISIVLITLGKLYVLTISFFPLLSDDTGFPDTKKILALSIPNLIIMISILFFSIQLINNKLENEIKQRLKYIGMGYLLSLSLIVIWIFFISIPAIHSFPYFTIVLTYSGIIRSLFFLIPYVAILITFIKELRIDDNPSDEHW